MKYKFLYIFFISHILYSQQFRNITNISDLNEVVGNNGVAVADYDNDGDLDIFIVSARSQDGEEYWSRLFENTNNGNFIDITESSGINQNLNHDIDLINYDEDGNFSFDTIEHGDRLAASWGDFNNDGFVDLYVGGYESWPKDTYADFILSNEEGKSFKVDWQEVRYRARGISSCDFDRDGDLDVYVSNYRLQPNILWQNNGKGKFTDITGEFGALANGPGFGGGHSIGASWGDFDNDGNFDLFAGNFAHKDSRGNQPESVWLRNTGKEGKFKFENKGQGGIFYQESYSSPSAADYDNDGNLDLLFTTVYGVASFGRKNNPVLFRNEGQFKFSNANAATKLEGLGATYQAAWADFDNDGDLDLMAAGRFFVNSGKKENHWLRIKLECKKKTVNRFAVGAQVRLKLNNGKILSRQVESGTGQGNQNELTLHFGLGSYDQPVKVEIFWPDGTILNLDGVPVDQKFIFNPDN